MQEKIWKPGTKISEPGIYAHLPLEEYHGDICAGHSVSHSSLDRIITHSPAAYFDASYINPDRDEESGPTEHQVLGSAAHHLFLGEAEFQKHFIQRPEEAPDGTGRKWNGNNNACKAWLEEQAKKKLMVLTQEQMKKIVRLARTLHNTPLISAGLLSGKIERSIIWQDEETGLWLKVRPDVIPHDGDFADLKITARITDDALRRTISTFGYHRQAALVMEGAHHVLGWPLQFRDHGSGEGMSTTLVFGEAVRPHCVEIVALKSSDIEEGMKENRAALRLLKRCLDTNEWPGPSGNQRDARYIGLSQWDIENGEFRRRQIEAMLSVGGEKKEVDDLA